MDKERCRLYLKLTLIASITIFCASVVILTEYKWLLLGELMCNIWAFYVYFKLR
jgi:hypothetical protein